MREVRRTVQAGSFEFEGAVIEVTVSIGVCTCQGGNPDSPDGIIRVADEYLYKAKHGGRNRTESELLNR